MKKSFEEAEVKIVVFQAGDIITSSNDTGDGGSGAGGNDGD